MTLTTRHEPIPPTPVPEGLIIQVCSSKTIDAVEKKVSCSTCGQLKTKAQLSNIKKPNGGVKCLICVEAAKNHLKPKPKLEVMDPPRPRPVRYPYREIGSSTFRPMK